VGLKDTDKLEGCRNRQLRAAPSQKKKREKKKVQEEAKGSKNIGKGKGSGGWIDGTTKDK